MLNSCWVLPLYKDPQGHWKEIRFESWEYTDKWSGRDFSRKFMYHTEISIVVVYLFICIAVDQLIDVYYPQEVSSMTFCCLGVFRKEYFKLVIN